MKKVYSYLFTFFLSFSVCSQFIVYTQAAERFDTFDEEDIIDWDNIDEELSQKKSLSSADKLWIAYQIVIWKTQALGRKISHHIEANKKFFNRIVHNLMLTLIALSGYYYLRPDDYITTVETIIKTEHEILEEEPNDKEQDQTSQNEQQTTTKAC